MEIVVQGVGEPVFALPVPPLVGVGPPIELPSLTEPVRARLRQFVAGESQPPGCVGNFDACRFGLASIVPPPFAN